MRVVGYVRDSPGPAEAEPAFAQAERIRRWVQENGHQLVAVCQDVRTEGRALGRDGFNALLGIVSTGQAEGVVVPDLSVLSADKILQEVMLWDLRRRGAVVLSGHDDDQPALAEPSAEQIRIVVRDVLAKVSSYEEELLERHDDGEREQQARRRGPGDVIIELIQPGSTTERERGPGSISPAR